MHGAGGDESRLIDELQFLESDVIAFVTVSVVTCVFFSCSAFRCLITIHDIALRLLNTSHQTTHISDPRAKEAEISHTQTKDKRTARASLLRKMLPRPLPSSRRLLSALPHSPDTVSQQPPSLPRPA